MPQFTGVSCPNSAVRCNALICLHQGHNIYSSVIDGVETGQEQDAVGGGFNVEESFVGEMSRFVLNDYIMSSSDIHKLAQPVNDTRCRNAAGTVLSWTDAFYNVFGSLLVSNRSRCLGEF